MPPRCAVAPALAQPAIDYAREDRWAQEVVPSIVVGDAVWLATPARAKVLAILTEPAGAPKGGVILIHGLGVHPDFGMIGGVRTALAEVGYTTLSVQMPVLAAGATRDDYAVALPAAAERIAAAIAYLRAKGIAKIAIVSHSVGATMVECLPRAAATCARIDAWVPIGMLVDFAIGADASRSQDIVRRERIRGSRRARRRCGRSGCRATRARASSRSPAPITTSKRRQKELAAAIAAFLDRVFSGTLLSSLQRRPPPC